MNLLSAIEDAVGNEYFDDTEYSLLNIAEQNTDINLRQVQQPNSNKIVFIP